MDSRRFVTCDVFTDTPHRGNPLAVLPDGSGLTGEQMQQIAGEFNLSETVFLLPGDADHDIGFRIFTPTAELPFAGHPTVGGAVVAAREGLVGAEVGTVRVREAVGTIGVELHRSAGHVVGATLTTAMAPERLAGLGPGDVAGVMSLEPDSVIGAPEVWTCGVPFVVVEVASVGDLGRVVIDTVALSATLADAPSGDLYVAAAVDGGYRVRMFAPDFGIAEDPATGAAASAFAGWWAARHRPDDGVHAIVLTQGVEMGRPSTLRLGITVTAGRAAEVRVGGDVVMMSEGTLRV